MSVATAVLAKVEAGRWQKAVEAWASGAYTISITGQSEQEVRGFVANGDGKEYGVTLAEGRSFCGCRDHMFRGGICKHMLALALHVTRPLRQAA